MRSGLGVIAVIFNYGLAFFIPSVAVSRLVPALESSDEDTSMAAYMVLVKLGPRINPYLLASASQGMYTAKIVQVLGDHGDASVIPDLEEYARSPDPAVASAALESLEILRSDGIIEDPL